MLRRELAIVFRARITWLQAALSALLVGHSFILAIDLYTAGSRSALASRLMSREFDPLLGIVRPTLGGVYVAVSLLGAVVAVRPLAIEKERRTLHGLLLQTASPLRVLAAMAFAGAMSLALVIIAPLALFALWVCLGGHLAFAETAVSLLGQALYILLIAAVGIAAASWTGTLAQAATATLVVIAGSWAIDAAEGFSALAWLGRALEWSVSTHMTPLERGILPLGDALWMTATALGALAVAYAGMRFDLRRRERAGGVGLALAFIALAGIAANRVRLGIDATEMQRLSLPAPVIAGLRGLPGPIALDVYLDRDDARRRQLEGDVITKLRLARPDLEVRTPTDAQTAPALTERDDDYGRVVIRLGDETRVTRSTSRKEIVNLVFEAAGQPLPDWSAADYPGYPLVVDGARRTAAVVIAYIGLPMAYLLAGLWATASFPWRPS